MFRTLALSAGVGLALISSSLAVRAEANVFDEQAVFAPRLRQATARPAAPREPDSLAADSLVDDVRPGFRAVPAGDLAHADLSGRNGAPRATLAQGHTFRLQCGFVYRRFFDAEGASITRAVRVCN